MSAQTEYMILDGSGRIEFKPRRRQQATKMTRDELREFSPSGVVHMDGMTGKNFTTWFLIKCGLFGVAAAYLFDWVIMSIPV